MGDHYILERYLSHSLETEELSFNDDPEEEAGLVMRELFTEKVPQWTVKEVCDWLKTIGFGDFCDVFNKVGVDGDILLLLQDSSMKEDLEMTNGILRKRFQRELRNLRKTSDYSCCGAEETAEFLHSISPDFREFTYNLMSRDMTVEHMTKLGRGDLTDMLKEAGIDNIVYQHRILEALESRMYDSDLDNSGRLSEVSVPESALYDVYLTCPRTAGAELASLIRMQLELRGFSVFCASDKSTGASGLATKNVKMIQETKHFVLVLVPGALDSCKPESGVSDKLREEIVTALSAGVNIVPVNADFQWPAPDELEAAVKEVAYFNCVRWVHEYQEACINKLERFLRNNGEGFLRIDSPFNRRDLARSRKSSGFSTPSLPVSRRPSEAPLSTSLLTSMLTIPKGLRRSNMSLVSTDSGMESHFY